MVTYQLRTIIWFHQCTKFKLKRQSEVVLFDELCFIYLLFIYFGSHIAAGLVSDLWRHPMGTLA